LDKGMTNGRRPLGPLSDLFYQWPGRRRFGLYAYLPIFFFAGAAMEFTMIHWTYGETNFYKTFKKRRAEELAKEQLREEGIMI